MLIHIDYGINQIQYDELKKYMSEIKNSKYAEWDQTVFFLENDSFSDSFYIDKLDERIEALKDSIVEIAIPHQYPIGQLDFSKFESKNAIMEQAEKYVNEMNNQERIYTQTNKSQQAKKDFFRTRSINTTLENEAREQVNIDMQEILDGHLDDRSQL